MPDLFFFLFHISTYLFPEILLISLLNLHALNSNYTTESIELKLSFLGNQML